MPSRRWEELKKDGIRVGVFFPPFLGWLNLRVNYRNHRKIAVIDGRVGFVGGFNIGREYISRDPRFGYWRDTHLKITGEAAIGLQIRFALDWHYATGKICSGKSAILGRRKMPDAGLYGRKGRSGLREARMATRPACRLYPAVRIRGSRIYGTTISLCFTRLSITSIYRPRILFRTMPFWLR